MVLVARCFFYFRLFASDMTWWDPYWAEAGTIPSCCSLTFNFLSRTVPYRFHNDGRMLDVFQRLTAKESDYFIPQDLEVSIEELSYIVMKAEQWRGSDGERRKVSSLYL